MRAISLSPQKKYYIIPSLFFLCMLAIEFITAFNKNHFIFTYTLDDTYIHLSLAQRIAMGTYGLNAGEYSSPDSSILWPFLLAPFSNYAYFYYVPLLINIVCALAVLWVFAFVMQAKDDKETLHWNKVLLLCLLTPALNLTGLVFVGMEHSLQVLLSVLLLLGLIQECKHHQFPLWLGCAIVLGPLIRYENLALSTLSLLFLFYRGHYKKALITLFCLGAIVLSFTGFLLHIGQPLLPASILSKTSTTLFSSISMSLLHENFLKEQAHTFLIYTWICLWLMFFSRIERAQKQIISLLLISLYLHLVWGKFGYGLRYEIYLHASFWFLIISLYEQYAAQNHAFVIHLLNKLRLNTPQKSRLVRQLSYVVLCGVLILASQPYFRAIPNIPTASNNIYLQQYQMHQLVHQWVKSPVAANDIGLLSFNNPYGVVDLWGLGNYAVTKKRILENNTQWMDELVQQHHVELVMIYRSWFPKIPEHWQLLGCLSSKTRKVSFAEKTVHFYATTAQSYTRLSEQLAAFQKALPAQDQFSTTCHSML